MSDENAGAKRPVRGIRVGVFENHRRLTALEERHESLRAQCERSVKKLTERVEQLEEIQKMQEMVDPCDLHEAKRFCANPKCICMDHWPPEPEQVENEIQWSINQDPKSWNTDLEPEQGEDGEERFLYRWVAAYDHHRKVNKLKATIQRLEEENAELAKALRYQVETTVAWRVSREEAAARYREARKLLEIVERDALVPNHLKIKIRGFCTLL